MKFRCERDTLADAIAVAQRAVASRTGALPVLSGLRVSPTASGIELVGSDLELTIRVEAPADTEGEGLLVGDFAVGEEVRPVARVAQGGRGDAAAQLARDERATHLEHGAALRRGGLAR